MAFTSCNAKLEFDDSFVAWSLNAQNQPAIIFMLPGSYCRNAGTDILANAFVKNRGSAHIRLGDFSDIAAKLALAYFLDQVFGPDE